MKRILGKTAGGFTLAEAMLATMILAIAAAGVLMPFVAGASVRAEGQRRTLGARLAAELIEKIVETDFYSIVGSYGSYSEAEGQIKDMTGAVFSDPVYANYSRTAECVEVYVSQEEGYTNPVGADDPIFIWATVNVYYRGKLIGTVSRLIAK